MIELTPSYLRAPAQPVQVHRVAVVTDSASDLSVEEARALGAYVVPAIIFFGSTSYRDGVDLTSEQFFQALGQTADLPRTMPADVTTFVATYMRLLGGGASAVLSIHTSSELSGALANARQAIQVISRQLGAPAPIVTLDSRQGGAGVLPAVRLAAQMAQVGAPIDVITTAVQERLTRIRMYFLVETLEYLQRGGRIGRAQRLLGTLLDAKPILTVQDGVVAPVEVPRPRERSYERLLELVGDLGSIEELYIGQTSDALGQEMVERLSRVYQGPIYRRWVGPGVGVHMGKGVAITTVLAGPSGGHFLMPEPRRH
ncbi:MAG TPA: DegV family protein [Ktedonobacterales bacterium]|nr:DegV family protein [Ktedonobacterales bacterium]